MFLQRGPGCHLAGACRACRVMATPGLALELPKSPRVWPSHGLSDASGEGSWPLHELGAVGQSGPIGKVGQRTQMLWSEGGTIVSLLGDLGPSLSLSAPCTRLSVGLTLVPARGVCRVTSDGTGRAPAHGPPQ